MSKLTKRSNNGKSKYDYMHRLNKKLKEEVKLYEMNCKKCGIEMSENNVNETCGSESTVFHFFS